MPVLLQGLADEQQPGGGQILFAGLCLPARLIPCRGQSAPEIHFVAEVEGRAQVAAGAAIFHVLGAAGPEIGADRGGEVGVSQIGAEQGILELEPGHPHVRVGGQHRLDQAIERRILESLPPGACLLSGETPALLLPCWRHVEIGSVIGALLAAGTEAGGEHQA